MLHDPARHEPLKSIAWDEGQARAMIERIVRDTERGFSPGTYWPIHPHDSDHGKTGSLPPLYYGACGVIWALHYLERIGAARLTRSYAALRRPPSSAQPGVARNGRRRR
jgi:hypothetical protein